MSVIEVELKRRRCRKVSSEWSRKQIINLIQQVKCRPSVWDFSHTDYKNRNIRRQLIEEIAFHLKKDAEEVSIKWQNLRSQFNAERRKLFQSKNCPGVKEKAVKWEYFTALNFLSPQVNESMSLCTSSMDHYEPVEQQTSKHPKKAVNDEIIRKAVEIISYEPVEQQTSKHPKKAVNDEIIRKAVEIISNPTDGPQIFGDYVAQKLRELPSHIAKRLQFEIEKKFLIATEDVLRDEGVVIQKKI